MGEFIIAIILSGILNISGANVPVVAMCNVISSENNLTVQGDIKCRIVVAGDVGLGITGRIYPLSPTVPDKNEQDYVYY